MNIFDVSLYPLLFFANTPFKNFIIFWNWFLIYPFLNHSLLMYSLSELLLQFFSFHITLFSKSPHQHHWFIIIILLCIIIIILILLLIIIIIIIIIIVLILLLIIIILIIILLFILIYIFGQKWSNLRPMVIAFI